MGVTDWKAKDFKKWVLSHPGQVILTVVSNSKVNLGKFGLYKKSKNPKLSHTGS